MTDLQQSIPYGWEWIPLAEIADVVDPQPSHRTLPKVEGGIPYVGMKDVRDERIDLQSARKVAEQVLEEHRQRYQLKTGDFFFGKIGTLGKPVMLPQPFNYSLSANVILVQPNQNLVLPQLIFYYLDSPSVRKAFKAGSRATTQAAFGIKKARKIPIPFPPLAEQHRIVNKIEELFTELDAGVALLKKLKRKLKRYRQAVLKAAVEGKLTQDWREAHQDELEPASVLLERILAERREKWEAEQLTKMEAKGKVPKNDKWKLKYKEPAALDTAGLPKLPKTWKWVSIEQISEVVRGASPRPAGDPKYFGGNTPWITVGSLTANHDPFLYSVSEFVTEAGRAKSRYVEPETFLLTNSGATLGVPKITKIGGCINDGSVALLRIEYPLKLYLYYFLSKLTEQLRLINQGAAQPNLNTGIVKAIEVPLPPTKEQFFIVEKLEEQLLKIDRVQVVIDKNLKRAANLRQSILKKAFEGQLVPQDSTDEPASALLERIQKEKEQKQLAEKEAKKTSRKKKTKTKKAEQLELLEASVSEETT